MPAIHLIFERVPGQLGQRLRAPVSYTHLATRAVLIGAALRSFDLVAKGDTPSLRQSAMASVASDFSGIEATVKDSQSALASSKATARPPFLLEAEGPGPIPVSYTHLDVYKRQLLLRSFMAARNFPRMHGEDRRKSISDSVPSAPPLSLIHI